MNTYVGLSFIAFNERISEIDTLISIASDYPSGSNEYNSICRATQVLLVGHLEGAIKELVKSLLDDLSTFVNFENRPEAVKRTFTTYYMKSEKGGKYDSKYQDRLLEVFSIGNVELRVEPYLFDQNKNPSPFIIDAIGKRFGIKDIISRFLRSDFDVAFEDRPSDLLLLKDRLYAHLYTNLQSYPYGVSVSEFNLQADNISSNNTSLWTTFLDGILKKRHGIAHGASLSNEVEIQDLVNNLKKVQIFLYGLYLIFCDEVVKKCT
jgi:hypothetical protein